MNPTTEENKVEFEGEHATSRERNKILYSRIVPSNIQPSIIKFLIAKHIIKDERQGDILLIIILVACFAASFVIFKYSSTPAAAHITKDAVIKVLLHK